MNPRNMQRQFNVFTVDREQTCPFLIRLFWKENDCHNLECFSDKTKEPVNEEIQIYTWMDASLREIIDQVKSNLNNAMKKDASFKIESIYQDPKGNWKRREFAFIHSVKRNEQDRHSLHDYGFKIGDYIDLTIITK